MSDDTELLLEKVRTTRREAKWLSEQTRRVLAASRNELHRWHTMRDEIHFQRPAQVPPSLTRKAGDPNSEMSIRIVNFRLPTGGKNVLFVCNKPVSREVETMFRELEKLGGKRFPVVFNGSEISMDANNDLSLAFEEALENLLTLAEKRVEAHKVSPLC